MKLGSQRRGAIASPRTAVSFASIWEQGTDGSAKLAWLRLRRLSPQASTGRINMIARQKINIVRLFSCPQSRPVTAPFGAQSGKRHEYDLTTLCPLPNAVPQYCRLTPICTLPYIPSPGECWWDYISKCRASHQFLVAALIRNQHASRYAKSNALRRSTYAAATRTAASRLNAYLCVGKPGHPAILG